MAPRAWFADTAEPVPHGMVTDAFLLRPITAADAPADHEAIMETRDELRVWEQSAWPEDDFTVAANREDLAGLEQRHRERRAFTYTVRDASDERCIGCVYVFPTTAAFLARSAVAALGDDRWEDVGAVVYFWLRRSARELEEPLLDALRSWFAEAWRREPTVFVANERFTRQVDLLSGSGLTRAFEVREPGKPGAYLGFVDGRVRPSRPA